MEKLLVKGNNKIDGKISVQTSKNAVLPILAASILTDKKVVLHKCPKITDVFNMIKILKELGCSVQWEGDSIIIDSASACKSEIPQSLAKELRSSVFMLGSILGRFHNAVVAYPGGCDIGIRPIDFHIKGLTVLNVKIEENGGTLYCDGRNMKGGTVHFDCPSVGATENIMMAAVLASGHTTIRNAAKEPEIVDLQNFINKMGGRVRGAGTSTIEIQGVKKLNSVEYTPIPDRIAAGTYLIAAAMTGGKIEVQCCCEHIYSLITKLRESSCKIDYFNDKIYLKGPDRLQPIHTVETMPYPGFPTDLQAQVLSLTTIADGTSIIVENIFETRFKHVAELIKMGANVTVRDRMAIVRGVNKLNGAQVYAHDLRGGAALVLAGLAAEGVTEISDIFHIDRGYENIEATLNALGGDIRRIKTFE
jgi:UDP-N-acetylglucosamine 1-carboxyvinyltransferase